MCELKLNAVSYLNWRQPLGCGTELPHPKGFADPIFAQASSKYSEALSFSI